LKLNKTIASGAEYRL